MYTLHIPTQRYMPAHQCSLAATGVAMTRTVVDVSARLLQEDFSEIDADPTSLQ